MIELSLPTNIEVGQSASLMCIGFGGHDKEVKITCMIGSLVVSNSLGVSVHEDHHVVDARKVKRSFLTIPIIKTEDLDTYTCVVAVKNCSVNSSLDLSVYIQESMFMLTVIYISESTEVLSM